MKKLWVVAGLGGMLFATSLQAAMVQEINVSPGLTQGISVSGGYSGDVYAGIYNLAVDGVRTPSFCIDLIRFSPQGSEQSYDYLSLASAPLAPAGPMGADAATDIQKLWAAYFTGATSDNLEAAALQVAIWMVVDNAVNGYTVTFTPSAAVTRAGVMLAALPGLNQEANLIALVNSTDATHYQNYVVPVPEPTTMIAGGLLLLPFAASTIRKLRKTA